MAVTITFEKITCSKRLVKGGIVYTYAAIVDSERTHRYFSNMAVKLEIRIYPSSRGKCGYRVFSFSVDPNMWGLFNHPFVAQDFGHATSPGTKKFEGDLDEEYEININGKWNKGARDGHFFSDDYAERLFAGLCTGDAKGLIIPGRDDIGFSGISDYINDEEARIRQGEGACSVAGGAEEAGSNAGVTRSDASEGAKVVVSFNKNNDAGNVVRGGTGKGAGSENSNNAGDVTRGNIGKGAEKCKGIECCTKRSCALAAGIGVGAVVGLVVGAGIAAGLVLGSLLGLAASIGIGVAAGLLFTGIICIATCLCIYGCMKGVNPDDVDIGDKQFGCFSCKLSPANGAVEK